MNTLNQFHELNTHLLKCESSGEKIALECVALPAVVTGRPVQNQVLNRTVLDAKLCVCVHVIISVLNIENKSPQNAFTLEKRNL